MLTCGVDGHTRTAGDTMAAIRSLAGGLTAAGFGAGATVALMAPNCPDFVVVFHAALYAGGTVTTLNPAYTAPEVAHQLRDSRARLLVTVPACLDAARAATDGTEIALADDCNPLMPQVRAVAADLARDGRRAITLKGTPVDLATVRGPIRLGLPQ